MDQRNDNARRLPLRARDGSVKAYALVSASDYEELSKHRWVLAGNGYVFRTVQLHREVLGVTGRDLVVDHINGDPLDNRRENLRPITPLENNHNRHRRRGTGAYQERGRWRARITHNRKGVHLGRYDSREKAERVVAAFKALNWPASPEAQREHRAEDLADAARFRLPPSRLTSYAAFSARLMLATTTLSQRDVADIVGISPSQLSAIKSGGAWASAFSAPRPHDAPL